MLYAKRRKSAGLSLMELLMVLGILAVLATMAMRSFSSANSSKALDTEAQHIVSELNRARSLTLSSKNSQSYGVRFGTSSVTFFQGPTFEAGSSTNETALLNRAVEIASTNVAGGGVDVVFERLTGSTDQYGTITLSLVVDPSSTKTVTIFETGLVEAP